MTGAPEVLEREVPAGLQVGGTVDVQVATARQYPRSITSFVRRATELATLTPEVAASCVYALPRDGKTVEGPSARLAEIVAHAWGNLRIQAGAGDGDGRYITARGEAWDVESNVAIGFEVKRRITNRKGETYNDDMIVVTGNAAASIALRNAVFKVVPTSFWKPIYLKCRQVVAGEARTFASRRDEMLKAFAVMGVTEERLCAAIGAKGKADVTLEHMVTLTGFYNALKDGETTIEEAFPEGGGLGGPQPAQRKSQQAANGQAPTPEPSPAPPGSPDAPVTSAAPAAVPSASVPPPPIATPAPATLRPIGVVADVQVRSAGTLVKLSTGFQCATKDAELTRALTQLRGTPTVVELRVRPARDARFAPVLEEILPVVRDPGSDDQ